MRMYIQIRLNQRFIHYQCAYQRTVQESKNNVRYLILDHFTALKRAEFIMTEVGVYRLHTTIVIKLTFTGTCNREG